MAFVGGMDLTEGRFDDFLHRVGDLDARAHHGSFFPGPDYYQPNAPKRPAGQAGRRPQSSRGEASGAGVGMLTETFSLDQEDGEYERYAYSEVNPAVSAKEDAAVVAASPTPEAAEAYTPPVAPPAPMDITAPISLTFKLNQLLGMRIERCRSSLPTVLVSWSNSLPLQHGRSVQGRSWRSSCKHGRCCREHRCGRCGGKRFQPRWHHGETLYI